MKKIKNLVSIALTGMMVFSFAGCSMIERTEESKQKTVLAKVGNKKITKADVDGALKTYLDYYKQNYGDDFESNESIKANLKSLRTKQLEGLVDQEVLLQSKDKLGVNPSDEEIQSEVDERVTYYREALGSDESYESFIEQYGYNDESFKEYLKTQAILTMVVDAMTADAEVTDEDIEKGYNDNIDKYTTKAGADVTHILVSVEKDSDGNVVEGSEEKAKAEAEKIRQRALAGQSLEDISKSDEFKDSCKYEDLGRVSFENSGMVQEFEDAFKVLPAGKVSDVVKTSFGYHVIVNTAVYPEDKVEPLNDELKGKIKNDLLYNKQESAYNDKIEELKKDIKIKIYENRI